MGMIVSGMMMVVAAEGNSDVLGVVVVLRVMTRMNENMRLT